MKPDYRIYAYFTDQKEADVLFSRLRARKARVKKAHGMPCQGLISRGGVIIIGPEVWDNICYRQGAWFRHSAQANKTLVTSPEPLDDMGEAVVITPSDFIPSRLPNDEEKQQLVNSEIYKDQMPEEYGINAESDIQQWKKFRLRLARRLGIDPAGLEADTQRTFLNHCANHANFLDPRFYLEEDGKKVPYSIDTTMNLCSACVEFFNIIGREYPVKYVAPCPGAVLAADLPADKYFRVEANYSEVKR
ncbi:MAG: hypothetical protein JSU92_06195 [Deltaproteobacteria bacterium]|nr:MAG: hypothetical protein JSU92_06195 [Deltaproteobacteria bacterium]